MPINITIHTNWLTRRNIRHAQNEIEYGTTSAQRDAGRRALEKIAMEEIMESVKKAIGDSDNEIKSAPPAPARKALQVRIYVEPDFGGGRLGLWIKKEDTVQHLKNIILEEMEVPIERQRLLYLGSEFQDGQRMDRVSCDGFKCGVDYG